MNPVDLTCHESLEIYIPTKCDRCMNLMKYFKPNDINEMISNGTICSKRVRIHHTKGMAPELEKSDEN